MSDRQKTAHPLDTVEEEEEEEDAASFAFEPEPSRGQTLKTPPLHRLLYKKTLIGKLLFF